MKSNLLPAILATTMLLYLRPSVDLIVVKANNIPELNFQCVPCISYGGYYCYDDPYKVNFNGDLCYENSVDSLACEGNYFSNQIDNCTIFANELLPTDECNITGKDLWKKWETPMTLNLTLPPRTTCGFHIYAIDANIQFQHKYPVTFFYH